MEDKRRHPRVPVNLPITCEIPKQASVQGILVDVSMGGAYVTAEVTPPFGAELTIIGDLPGAPGSRLPSVVRWAKPGGFGVQFGLLGALETHALGTLIRTKAV